MRAFIALVALLACGCLSTAEKAKVAASAKATEDCFSADFKGQEAPIIVDLINLAESVSSVAALECGAVALAAKYGFEAYLAITCSARAIYAIWAGPPVASGAPAPAPMTTPRVVAIRHLIDHPELFHEETTTQLCPLPQAPGAVVP